MYNGEVFVEGATGATAFYNPTSGTWSSGPSQQRRLLPGRHDG
jgi:hypothetical protein